VGVRERKVSGVRNPSFRSNFGLRISDCGFMESLRFINYNGQNSLNLKSKFKNLILHPTFRGTKMGLKSFYENKQFSPPQVLGIRSKKWNRPAWTLRESMMFRVND
jgi:hypothetical protein